MNGELQIPMAKNTTFNGCLMMLNLREFADIHKVKHNAQTLNHIFICFGFAPASPKCHRKEFERGKNPNQSIKTSQQKRT